MVKLIRLMLCSLLAAAPAARAGAQCCGDCNGDGTVTINELITAVNNALDACGAATPTPANTFTPTPRATDTPAPTPAKTFTPTHRPTNTPTPIKGCPVAFTDTNPSTTCSFSGTYNRGCGSALNSIFLTDGTHLTVEIGTMLAQPQVVYFGATVDSATSAHLDVWSTDAFQTSNTLAGTIQLNGDGTQLVVFPNDPPFMITGCNFVQYISAYTGTVGAQSVIRSAAPEQSALFDRLRVWHARPIPELGP